MRPASPVLDLSRPTRHMSLAKYDHDDRRKQRCAWAEAVAEDRSVLIFPAWGGVLWPERREIGKARQRRGRGARGADMEANGFPGHVVT